MVSASDILHANILIVDDQAANVLLLEQMLRGAGYTSVASTRNPADVRELQRTHRYGLILLDLQMPGMDGFQVLEGLKDDLDSADYLPVLVITAQPGHKLRALQAGAKDFISKPFDLAEVLTRVRNMLEVRLLHVDARNYSTLLEQTVREVEASREVIRRQGEEVRSLYDQVVIEQRLADRLLLNVLPEAITVRPDVEIRQLVPAFLARRAGDVAALRAALAGLDFSTIRLLGHTIKETGRGYGFDGITEIGSAIERAAHHEDGEAVDTRINQLAVYLRRVHVVELEVPPVV
jgi:adenylate cyclase